MDYAVFCADIGTSSLKAALITNTGRVVCRTTEKLTNSLESDKWLKVLSNASHNIIHDILFFQKKDSYLLDDLRAICISGNGPSLTNDSGTFLWNEPYTNDDIVTDILKYNSSFSLFLPRILHIKHNMKQMWNSKEMIFSVPEYVVYKLTGTAQTVLPNERFKTAYWTDIDLRVFGIPENKVPPIVKLGTCAGFLTKDAANSLGFKYKQNIKVFCGGPDFSIALIGTNTLSPGKICDRAGTSEGINLCTSTPIKGKYIRTLPSPINNLWNASVIIPDSGLRFSAWKHHNLYADIPYDQCVKYLLNHQDNDGYKLILKIAMEVRQAFLILINAASTNKPFSPEVVYSTGGQAGNAVWTQMKADIIGLPIHVSTCYDSELTGDAMLALYGLGEYSSIEKSAAALIHTEKVYTPDFARQREYFKQYKTL